MSDVKTVPISSSPISRGVPEDYIPPVEVGQIVHWFPGGRLTDKPCAAVITALGLSGQTLNLNILDPMSLNFLVKDGVRHIQDSRARQSELFEFGAWDHTHQTKRLIRLERLVDGLADVKK